jgi:hypothetical protein
LESRCQIVCCSERRRFGFTVLGHYDTWLVDALQIIVLANRGRVLYLHWSNASEYKDTDESFDTVAIHSLELDHSFLMMVRKRMYFITFLFHVCTLHSPCFCVK